MRRSLVAVVASAGLASLVMTAPPAAAGTGMPAVAPCTPYVVPGLPGGDGGAEVMSINDAGLYVGAAGGADGVPHAVWWTHAGNDLSNGWTIHQLPLPADNTEVLDVNRDGVMSGADSDNGQSFVFDSRSGALTWLPTLAGGSWTWGRRINASGEVSGAADARDGVGYATVWYPPYTKATRLADAGASQSVGTQGGAKFKIGSEATGINDQGTAAGQTTLGGPVLNVSLFAQEGFFRGGLAPLFQAVEWRSNGQVDRLPAGISQGFGFAINNAGTVVGAADFADSQAWLAPAAWIGGRLVEIPAPSDLQFGIARNVSQGGWATGGIALADGSSRAFVWTGSGALQALTPAAGFTDGNAHAVDDLLGELGGDSEKDGAQVGTVWQCPAGFTTG